MELESGMKKTPKTKGAGAGGKRKRTKESVTKRNKKRMISFA
jgi:hypothetical protein